MNISEIYQEIILDHSRHPRNYGSLPNATHCAKGRNPLCGDEITVSIRAEGDQIREIRFCGSACAICTASASIMTKEVRDLSIEKVDDAFQCVRSSICQGLDEDSLSPTLKALSGVHKFPQRIKCAVLPWETLVLALQSPAVSASKKEA